MFSSSNVYRFRVQIEDACLFDASSILSIFVQHGHRLSYADLLDRIVRSHPKVYSERVPYSCYYLLINNQGVYDDSGLQKVLSSTSATEIHYVKLLRKSSAPLITTPTTQNIIIPQPDNDCRINNCDLPSITNTPYNNNLRRDSGISFFEQDLMKFTINKRADNNTSRRPSTAYISPETTPTPTYHNSPVLSFLNTDNRDITATNKSIAGKIRLPGVSSLFPSNDESRCCYNPQTPAPSMFITTPPTPPMPLRRSSCCPEFSTGNITPLFQYPHQQYISRRHSTAPIVHHNKISSSTKRQLNQRQQHTFICDHIVDPKSGRRCSQSFRRSYDLSRHQTIHLKNRPFCVCHFCGKKFTRLDALRRHERIQGHILHC